MEETGQLKGESTSILSDSEQRLTLEMVYLVLHGDLGAQSVARVPFLAEVEAQLVHFELGLQVAAGLPCVGVAGARGGKLLQDREEGGSRASARLLREESISFCPTERLRLH